MRKQRTAMMVLAVLQAAHANMICAARAADGSLQAALSRIGNERNIALLFDPMLVAGLKARPYKSDLPIDQLLAMLLRGTGLTAARLASGAFVIRKAPATPGLPPQKPAASSIPDILVTGHSTGNVDIQRGPDDIQPYQILPADRVDASLARTSGELVADQVSMNLAPPAALSNFRRQSVGSYVDLNGIGSQQTLLTIDGRRLPQTPGSAYFQPPDVGALTPEAIERVEVLGLTAGGIFGVGATGGALNLVLKHDYRGFEINLINGASQRGDDTRHGIEAKAGFETSDGRTKGLVRVGYGQAGGVVLGSRDVGNQQLALFQKLYPGAVNLNQDGTVGNGVFYRSLSGAPLQVSQAYGGASLGQATTWLPLNAPAAHSGGIAVLLANAGKPLTTLSPDGQGALGSLVPATRNLSVNASLRQVVGDHIELFADALLLYDSATSQTAAISTGNTFLFAGETGNPFTAPVYVSYPVPGPAGHETNTITIDRETLGVILRLGHGWSATADVSRGAARTGSQTYDANGSGSSAIDFLAGANSLASQLGHYNLQLSLSSHGIDRLYDTNVRVAGPLLRLPGGQATLTATGEWRRDSNPGIIQTSYAADGTAFPDVMQGEQETVASGFIEARLPILPAERGFVLTRGLKVQIAARHDRYAIVIPGSVQFGMPATYLSNHRAVTAFTGGASIEPVAGLMLRASFASGYEPPTAQQLVSETITLPLAAIVDPKRGGTVQAGSASITEELGGEANLGPQRVRTLSIGLVLTPRSIPGLHLSFDVSQLMITHAATTFANGDMAYFLAHEAQYPGRVLRAPLTAADAALGDTGGQIEDINTGTLDIGRQLVEVFQAAVDYRHPLGHGAINLFGSVSWEPLYGVRTDPALGSTNLSGLLNGPMPVRAVSGVSLAWMRWDVGLNARYYGAFRTAYYEESQLIGLSYAAMNGIVDSSSVQIPARTYLDLALAYSWPAFVGSRKVDMRYRLGVQNLLDVAPSPLASSYSAALLANPYNDPIGRRFEFEVMAKF